MIKFVVSRDMGVSPMFDSHTGYGFLATRIRDQLL